MIVVWLTFLLSCLLLFKYHYERRNLYRAALQYNGDVALPLIGNALTFAGSNVDILNKIYDMVLKHDNPLRVWMGPMLFLIFKEPSQVEKILSSSKFAYKHESYDYLKPIMGEGLVTGSGPNYKVHRRIIQPMINMKYCENALGPMQKNMTEAIKELEQKVGQKTPFDIHHAIHKGVVGFIGEIVMGHKFDYTTKTDKDYVQAAIDMYDHGFTRLVRPWIQPEAIHRFTDHRRVMDRLQAIVRNFVASLIADSKQRRSESRNDGDPNDRPLIDQITDHRDNNPDAMNDEDFVSHMITLYAASEDTLTIISSFLCVCLGMYPEYQNKVAEEISDVFGTVPRRVTLDDIGKLSYLDRCIKDVLRLIPIAPYIIRRTLDDSYIDNYYLPKGAAVLIPIHNIHRDPRFWENPFHFHPDHFLPEAVSKRPVYAYVPFSAGPRSCVGKTLANVGLKTIMAMLLQRFEFQADGKFPDLRIRMDISVRPVDGYNLRLKQRTWNQ